MGLDMYARSGKPSDFKNPEALVDLNVINEDVNLNEFFYWRKHNALHHWMQQYYNAHGGTDPDFNLNTLRLTPELLASLEADILAKKLTPVGGFFFGSTDYDPSEEMKNDLDFIVKARIEIANGNIPIYYAWY